jgi:gamma-glutamyltranspeptidase/glutathione hydrolase
MIYAIELARSGFPALDAIVSTVQESAAMFAEHWPSSATLYSDQGRPISGRMTNEQLAITYQRVLSEAEAASKDRDDQIEAARRAFYEGFVAEAIAAFVADTEVMDATGQPHRGLLSFGDLEEWGATIEDPVARDYHGLTVLKTGPWGQGPVFSPTAGAARGFRSERDAGR